MTARTSGPSRAASRPISTRFGAGFAVTELQPLVHFRYTFWPRLTDPYRLIVLARPASVRAACRPYPSFHGIGLPSGFTRPLRHLDAEWIGPLDHPPKAADFKGWANIFAERLCESGRLRTYLKTIADKTWDITVWLQHNSNATPVDADIVLEATGHLIGTLGRLIRRHELDEPDRCPRCDSYRVREDIENDATDEGFWESDICAACGWQSERIFTSWRDHFEGTDIEGYLASPGSGVGAGQQAAARLDDGQ